MIRLVTINAVVFFVFLLLVEVASRAYLFAERCFLSSCGYEFITSLKVNSVGQPEEKSNVGLTVLDDQLGYAIRKNIAITINSSEWENVRVETDEHGFRKNKSNFEKTRSILIVGDSFTFGDQVSDDETWISCVDEKHAKALINAGVPGYGAAQALKRAEIILSTRIVEELNIDEVWWAILVGEDFKRDRSNYRSGFPMTPVILDKDEMLRWASPPSALLSGTKYNPRLRNRKWAYFYERSVIVKYFLDKIRPGYVSWQYSGFSDTHPDAAQVDSIIKWSIKRFGDLDIKKNIILLYPEQYDDDRVGSERVKIKNHASANQIGVIDLLPFLVNYERDELWNVHHTARGNQLVCESILQLIDRI